MLDLVFFNNSVFQYLLVLAYLVGAFVAAKVVYFFFKNVASSIVAKTKTKFDDVLVELIEAPLIWLIVIFGVYLGLKQLTLPVGIADSVYAVFFIAVVGVLTSFGLRFVTAFFKYWLKPLTRRTDSSVDEQLLPVANKVAKLIVLVFAFIVILSHFGYDVSALVAGLGIGGLAVALASKDYLENILAGLTIFTDKPFKLGERITIDGVEGMINEVGIRSTRILTFDNTIVVIPNAKMVNSVLTNYSAPDRTVAVKLNLGLTYDTSNAKMKKAKDIVRKAVKSTKGVAKGKDPLVYFTNFADSSLTLWIKYWIEDYSRTLSIKDSVNSKVKEGFEKARIDFAFPTQTVHVKK